MQITGPALDARAQCERVLRSLPMWFGIEEALLMYAADSARLATFAVVEHGEVQGFATLQQHFPQAWEVHCIAVHAAARGRGIGTALMTHAEGWLAAQGASVLQVKTVAEASGGAAYAQTRAFYLHLGYAPLEVFPLLWSAHNPCLQMIKFIGAAPVA